METFGRARQATDGNIRRRMRIASRIPKATDTHSEYVILITFSRQRWLRERFTLLRHMYTACLGTLTTADNVISSCYPFSMFCRMVEELDRLQNKFTHCKGIRNNTGSRETTGVQEELDTTCTHNAS